jgi:hypothetical protein
MSGEVSICPPASEMPHIDNGPYKTIALILTIAVPFLLVGQYALFVYYRSKFVFLRKRSLAVIAQAFAATAMAWGYTALYDYVGSGSFPCWVLQVLHYSAGPLLGTANLIQTSLYISEITIVRLRRTLKEAGDENSLRRLKGIDGNGSGLLPRQVGRALLAHLRVIFKIKMSRENRLRERIWNVKFVRSPWFNIFWVGTTYLPFVTAFAVRMGTDPQLTQCNGCELSTFDAAYAIGLFMFATSVGEASGSSRVSQVDALRIFREVKLSWRTGYLIVLSFILYLADPGGAYASHVFNWRILFLVGAMALYYIKTTHQVLMAHYLRRQLLTNNFIAREDRFEDVFVRSKDLRQAFRNHLDGELSSEIYQFLDDVDELRANWEREKEGRQGRARRIFDAYIQKRSPMEINLSAAVRTDLVNAFVKGNVSVNCFDDAYAEIKTHLLSDGFARFLSKLGDLERQKQERRGSKQGSKRDLVARVADQFTPSSPVTTSESLV